MTSPRQFQRRLRQMDDKLRVKPMAQGGYRITREGAEICQTRTLGSHVETALKKGSLRRDPDIWTKHMAEVRGREAAVARDGRLQEAAGRAELARAIAFDLHCHPRVGSTARYRAGYDNIFRKRRAA